MPGAEGIQQIMDGYRVDDYRVYAEAYSGCGNELFILDQIRLRTRLEVQILSNSEHRFVSYKALAAGRFDDDPWRRLQMWAAALADHAVPERKLLPQQSF